MTAEINFISLKPGSDETRIMHTRSDNIEIMIGDDNDDIIEKLFKSFSKKYEENLQNKMRGSDFEFDGVNFLYYDFNKISLNRDIDLDFPSTSKDWKKFEQNNEIELNILYVPHNTRKIYVAYKSKHNLTCDKHVILLMISNGENWHYLTVKNLPGLLRGITSNHKEDFYCLNCFRSYRTKNKLEEQKKICENHNYCNVEMPTKDNNTIKYNQGEKSIKLPFVVYADLEYVPK